MNQFEEHFKMSQSGSEYLYELYYEAALADGMTEEEADESAKALVGDKSWFAVIVTKLV